MGNKITNTGSVIINNSRHKDNTFIASIIEDNYERRYRDMKPEEMTDVQLKDRSCRSMRCDCCQMLCKYGAEILRRQKEAK